MKGNKHILLIGLLWVLMILFSACSCEHEYDEWKLISPSTCTTEGVEERICKKCEEKESRSVAIAHSSTEWSIEKEATLTDEGIKILYCSACQKNVQTEKISALLEYRLLDNGEYEISGYNASLPENLTIPTLYNGKTISAIGESAFKEAEITTVVIPENIKLLRDHAFSSCKNLSNIVFPKSIRRISSTAFDGCNSLLQLIDGNIANDVTLSDKNKVYKVSDTVQIRNGAKLLIEEGVYILGNNNSIINYGEVVCTGSNTSQVNFYDLIFISGNINAQANTFHFNYSNLYGGAFSPATGYESHSNILLDHCSFYDSTEYSYIWYPESCEIINSYFENWHKISIGTDAIVNVKSNTFYNCGQGESVIECWAAYAEPINVNNNNFTENNGYALALKYDASRMNAQGNWFGTSNESDIKQLISDGNSDYSVPNVIDYSNWKNERIEE